LTNEGVIQFNQLMEEVEEERISPEGKKFDSDFQMEMAATT
jgi:hypothetical protein